MNLFKLDISQLRLLRISSDNLTAFTSPRILKLIIKSPSFDLKPKWLPDEKVVTTKLGYEHKDTDEILVSFLRLLVDYLVPKKVFFNPFI